MNTATVADRLGITPARLKTWVTRGHLTVWRPGHRGGRNNVGHQWSETDVRVAEYIVKLVDDEGYCVTCAAQIARQEREFL